MVKFENSGLGYSYHLPAGGIGLKIRNTLSQFSDLFSEFNKYIAPAYHHDRCERSVPMRLYSMNKREFVMVFVAFFSCFGLSCIIGVAGPPISTTLELNGEGGVSNNSTVPHSPTDAFIMKSPTLVSYAQQLWIIVKITTGNTDDETLVQTFQAQVELQGVTEDHKPVDIIAAEDTRNRTRHLRCVKQTCDEFVVLHLAFLKYRNYLMKFRFYGLEAFHKRYTITNIGFYFRTYNPAFTQIEISFRFIYLFATFVVTVWFLNPLQKYPMSDWATEQRWMSVLLPLLLAYNNPTFPLTLLCNSWIPGMIDALCQTAFLCALLLFWLCVYHGLRQNDRKFFVFYLPKIFIVGVIWITSTIMSTWQRYNEFKDPTFDHRVDAENFNTVKVLFFFFGGIYLAYLCYLILKAYSELRAMPYLDLRLKFLTLLMLFVVVMGLTATMLKFGVGVLEDNFVAQLSTHYQNSAHFMSFYGMLNIYCYTMAYVYFVGCQKSPQDSIITKDNPAFSMINDSDEDVIYGSDEESRRPLNRSRNDDDSD